MLDFLPSDFLNHLTAFLQVIFICFLKRMTNKKNPRIFFLRKNDELAF